MIYHLPAAAVSNPSTSGQAQQVQYTNAGGNVHQQMAQPQGNPQQQSEFVRQGIQHYSKQLQALPQEQRNIAIELINGRKADFQDPDQGQEVFRELTFNELFEAFLEDFREKYNARVSDECKLNAPSLVRNCLNITYLECLGKSPDFEELLKRRQF